MCKKQIQQLKQAAEQQDWESFQKSLKLLTVKIEHESLLNLLLKYVNIFMFHFLSMNPQYLLGRDSSLISDDPQISSEYLVRIENIFEQHKGEPGVNNLRKAVSKLQKMLQFKANNEVFVETFANATINTFIAISSQSWGTQYPRLYDQWLHGTRNEDLLILTRHYATNLEQIEKTRLLLHQFAKDVELLIQSDE